MIIASHTPEGKPIARFHKTKSHQTYKTKDGIPVPGVTTVLKILGKGDALLDWAWKLGKEGKDYRKVRDNAADIGSIAHFMIECDFKGEAPDLSEFAPADQIKATNCYDLARKYLDREKFTPVAQELQLASDKHRFGGTIDSIWTDREGAYVLLDWKTSKRIYDEYLLQVSAYRELWNEHNPDKIITRSIIVRIGKDGGDDFETREVYNHDAQFKTFLAILGAHQALQALKN